MQRDNILSDYTDQLLSGKSPNISETEIGHAETRENQKLVQLIYRVGREGIPDKEVSIRIRKTLEAEWKTKWSQKKSGTLKQKIFELLPPKKSEWKSTKQRQKNLTVGLALLTIIVLAVIIVSPRAETGSLPGAANQGGVIPIIFFFLLVLGVGIWWVITRKR